jgi:predicted nucleotidyltransferase component of viral defense system
LNKPEIKDFPASIHARLLNQARASGRPFNELLQYYAIERFLYRLAQSQFADQFVLKGALLFRVWGLPAFRPTRDIDLLGHTGNKVENLVRIVKEVCGQEVQEDGFLFDPNTVAGERIKEDADYEGVRVRLVGLLRKARVHLQIDIGFADVVSPAPVVKTYPVILAMPAPELRSYPPETVIAEKLQAMIYLGVVNSRMKDYYDLWVLANRFKFDGDVLQKAIHGTFEHRNTIIPAGEPAALSVKFAQDKQSQWEAFLKTSTIKDAPDQLEIVLSFLQEFALPIFQSTHAVQKFTKKWKKGGPWK